MQINKIHNMDCLEGLRLMENNSVDTCVTSPPYFGLRLYLPDMVKLKENAPEWVVKELQNAGIKPLVFK